MGKILVIDDEDQIRAMLRQALESSGHEVLEAINGKEGVRIYQEQPADLVITDILMPEKEGIETIMVLKQAHPGMPILAISGGGRSGAMDFLDMARALGADEALQKPFRRAELLEAVNRLIGS